VGYRGLQWVSKGTVGEGLVRKFLWAVIWIAVAATPQQRRWNGSSTSHLEGKKPGKEPAYVPHKWV